MIDENTKQKFMNKFCEKCERLHGVQSVEFFGSFETDKWRHGESDIDIIIYGQNVPGDAKYKISKLLRDLNYEYDLRLDNVHCAHPTPFFLDSPQRIKLFERTMRGHSRLMELGREYMKRNALTYKQIWAIEDSAKALEKFLPVPLSDIFDKFR